jgi:hypothetical protein
MEKCIMKKKYSDILKESLINFDGLQTTSGTVSDIVNFKGKGDLPTHKKASNVVSVLEDMYYKEDNDLPMVKEGEETEAPVGDGPEKKVIPDTTEKKVGDLHKADGVANANPDDKKEFDDTLVDASSDDKTLATESVEESLFEEGDADIDSEPVEENLENEPDHEALGDAGNNRDTEIGDGAGSLDNNNTLGDEEIDGMEKETEGLPETMEGDSDLLGEMEDELDDEDEEPDDDEEEAPESEEMEEMEDDLAALPSDAEDEKPDDDEEGEEATGDHEEPDDDESEVSELDEEDPGDESELGDEEPEGDESEVSELDEEEPEGDEPELGEEEPEMEEMGDEIGGDEELDDGMGDESELGDEEPEGDEPELGEEEPEVSELDEEPVEGDDEDLARLPGEENPEGEEGGDEEAPVLDVDSEDEDTIKDRESCEESIVERLIREMQIEENVYYSEVDFDLDDLED